MTEEYVDIVAAFGYQREFLIHLELTETQRVVEEGEEEEGK